MAADIADIGDTPRPDMVVDTALDSDSVAAPAGIGDPSQATPVATADTVVASSAHSHALAASSSVVAGNHHADIWAEALLHGPPCYSLDHEVYYSDGARI